VFASNQKFADLLKSRGIEPPKKISKTTGKETWALARNDRAFKDLCHDESLPLEVQAILAARVNAKSTIEETRTERMLGLAKRGWSDRDAGWMPAPETVTHPYAPYLSAINGTGWMPVPLRYYGAHTGRFSGDGGFNFQNFKRDSRIKAAIRAPTGYRIIHRDSSQIEARMVAFLAGCDPLLKAFAEGRDVYCEFGTSLYDRTITKADKVQRWVSKTAVLGLGYGMGAERFKHTLYIGSAGISLDVSLEDAQHIVTHYRRVFPEIPLLWRRAEYLLRDMIALGSEKLEGQKNPKINQKPRGKVPVVGYTANAILLPNGLKIIYPELTEDEDGEFTYCTARNEQKKLFGGKITENISQALARIVITDIMVRVYKDTGYHPILMTHDSLDYVCPESEVHDWDRYLEEQFALRPAWAPELPLASEGGWGSNLLNAEKHENA
jgi:DNA polymerase